MAHDIGQLYDTAVNNYFAFLRARVGQSGVSADGQVRYHAVRPKQVREAHDAWVAAHEALRDAGGTMEVVRDMLRARSITTKGVKR